MKKFKFIEELKDKNILVTGGRGFLGSVLVPMLEHKKAKVSTFSSKEYDLRNEEQVVKLLNDTNPNIVIHLAVDGGGIGYMKDHPGSVFYNNIMMNTILQEQCRIKGIEKFVGVGSVCEYPKFVPTPFKEEYLWDGYPEETNAPYGLAKKMMMVQSQAYREQYDFNAIHLLPVNLYGIGDSFDLEKNHVIPALIKRFDDAKMDNLKDIILWGTGNASREFLYIDDCADAIVKATEHYNKSGPINIGTGLEITIKNLANEIKSIVGFEGRIKWDTTKPDGQPHRCLDITKAEKEFGFKAKTNLKEGLKNTFEWYESIKMINPLRMANLSKKGYSNH